MIPEIVELVDFVETYKIGPRLRESLSEIELGAQYSVATVLAGGIAGLEPDQPVHRRFFIDPEKPFNKAVKSVLQKMSGLNTLLMIEGGYIRFQPHVDRAERLAIATYIRANWKPRMTMTIDPEPKKNN
jgi:hypothetical protein